MMLKRFLSGFSFFKEGWTHLKQHRSLWTLVLIPILLSVSFFIMGLIYLMPFVPEAVVLALGYVFSQPEGLLYQILYYPLWLIFGFVFFAGISVGTYLVASVVISPLNGYIAEKVLTQAGYLADQKFSLSVFLKTSLKMFLASILRGLLLLFVGISLFALSFLPGLNFLTSYMTFILVAFDSTDYAMELLEYPVSRRFSLFRSYFAEYAGMGAMVGFLMLVPGLIFFVMPISVVGATLIVGRLHDSRSTA